MLLLLSTPKEIRCQGANPTRHHNYNPPEKEKKMKSANSTATYLFSSARKFDVRFLEEELLGARLGSLPSARRLKCAESALGRTGL